MASSAVVSVDVVVSGLAFLWLFLALLAPLTTRVTSLGEDWYEVRELGRVTRYKYLGSQDRYVEMSGKSVVRFKSDYETKACRVFAREDGVEFVCGPNAAGWLIDLSNEVDNTARRKKIGVPPAPMEGL